MKDLFSKRAREHAQLFDDLCRDQSLVQDFDRLCQLGLKLLKDKGKILFCGNGGSASDAQHLAAELTGRYLKDREAIPALALHSNSSHLTAVANDYGYEETFARMVQALGNEGDMLIALSTSGNSDNVVRAAARARAQNLFVVGFTGASGGKLLQHSDLCLKIPSMDTARIQEMHIFLGHVFCEYLEESLFPE